jgi:hypothetical protein
MPRTSPGASTFLKTFTSNSFYCPSQVLTANSIDGTARLGENVGFQVHVVGSPDLGLKDAGVIC